MDKSNEFNFIQRPGASNMEVNSFLKSIYSENKAFNVLKGP